MNPYAMARWIDINQCSAAIDAYYARDHHKQRFSEKRFDAILINGIYCWADTQEYIAPQDLRYARLL